MTTGKLNGTAETALERTLRPFGFAAVMKVAPVLYTERLSVTEIEKIEVPESIKYINYVSTKTDPKLQFLERQSIAFVTALLSVLLTGNTKCGRRGKI
jgi:hypothetical protein